MIAAFCTLLRDFSFDRKLWYDMILISYCRCTSIFEMFSLDMKAYNMLKTETFSEFFVNFRS